MELGDIYCIYVIDTRGIFEEKAHVPRAQPEG